MENMSTEALWGKYVALDIDIRNNSNSEEFMQGDAMDTPLKNESFDYFIAICFIEYLKDPAQCLNELHRVAIKEGLVFVSTLDNFPFIFDPVNWIRNYFKKPVINFGVGGFGHLSVLHKSQWGKVFEDTGFIVEDAVGSERIDLFVALEFFVLSIFFSRKEYVELMHDLDRTCLGSKYVKLVMSAFKPMLYALYRFLSFLNIRLRGKAGYHFVLRKAG